MSGAPATSSSGAAEAIEEALMIGDDLGNVLRLRRGVPYAMAKELEAKARAAEAIAFKLGGAYQSSGKAES